ncbi:molybdenum cofactor biosynthesis A domain protein [Haemophilus influenzae]|nr:molybdenum cofactor biosynthesis A domain protein [Haemophilus influenzae]
MKFGAISFGHHLIFQNIVAIQYLFVAKSPILIQFLVA